MDWVLICCAHSKKYVVPRLHFSFIFLRWPSLDLLYLQKCIFSDPALWGLRHTSRYCLLHQYSNQKICDYDHSFYYDHMTCTLETRLNIVCHMLAFPPLLIILKLLLSPPT